MLKTIVNNILHNSRGRKRKRDQNSSYFRRINAFNRMRLFVYIAVYGGSCQYFRNKPKPRDFASPVQLLLAIEPVLLVIHNLIDYL